MKDNSIIENIKYKDINEALKEMQDIFQKILQTKLNEYDIEFYKEDFMSLLDLAIKHLRQYYDILTYLKNIYFFSEITDSEKLYELINIYEVLE